MNPALGAMKAPFANVGAGYEQRPCPDGAMNNKAMTTGCTTENHAARSKDTPPAIGHFHIFPGQYDRHVVPRVIVKRALVVASLNVVQIHIEPTVARDQKPPPEIGISRIADHEVRRALEEPRDHFRGRLNGRVCASDFVGRRKQIALLSYP